MIILVRVEFDCLQLGAIALKLIGVISIVHEYQLVSVNELTWASVLFST